jgi:hypothetical protein
MYVGLWSRLEAFERRALTEALERRAVVQGTLMRITIHLVSRRDYWPFAIATRAARRRQWLRAYPEPGPRGMAAAARTVRRRIAGGTLARREIEALVGRDRARGVGLWVDLLRAPSGTWERRRADLFAAADDWLGPPEIDERAAAEHLVRRYLAGFGPAAAKDVANFTGLPPAAVQRLLGRLELRRFRAADSQELLDVPGGPLPDPDTPAPPRFLPTFDATLFAHARRTGLLPEAYRPWIFNVKAPQSFATVLVDGRVAGTWRREDGAIRLQPFEPLDGATRRALADEAEGLAAFVR